MKIPYQCFVSGQAVSLANVCNIQRLQSLGKGVSSLVCKAIDLSGRLRFALKVRTRLHACVLIEVQEIQDYPSYKDNIRREIGAYVQCSHPNILRMYNSFYNEGMLAIALEYMDAGTLQASLHVEPLPPQCLPVLAKQLLPASRTCVRSGCCTAI